MSAPQGLRVGVGVGVGVRGCEDAGRIWEREYPQPGSEAKLGATGLDAGACQERASRP